MSIIQLIALFAVLFAVAILLALAAVLLAFAAALGHRAKYLRKHPEWRPGDPL